MIKRDKSEREKNERKAEMETHRNQNIKKVITMIFLFFPMIIFSLA